MSGSATAPGRYKMPWLPSRCLCKQLMTWSTKLAQSCGTKSREDHSQCLQHHSLSYPPCRRSANHCHHCSYVLLAVAARQSPSRLIIHPYAVSGAARLAPHCLPRHLWAHRRRCHAVPAAASSMASTQHHPAVALSAAAALRCAGVR